MKKRTLSIFAALATFVGVLCLEPAAAFVDDGFAVVVNPENEITFDSVDAAKAEVKRLYLKRASSWSGGLDAAPFGRAEDSDEQAAFLDGVLGMTTAELARHWITEKNKNGTTKPKETRSSRILVKFIKKYEGAFSVVTPAEAEENDLRILFTF